MKLAPDDYKELNYMEELAAQLQVEHAKEVRVARNMDAELDDGDDAVRDSQEGVPFNLGGDQDVHNEERESDSDSGNIRGH